MRRPSPARLVAAGSTLLLTLAALGIGIGPRVSAQDEEASPYEFQRKIRTATGAGQPRVAVCEFFTQGTLQADGKNLAVEDNRHHAVPWRVLQVGPGDACQVHIQTSARGFGAIWQAVVNDFHRRHPLAGVRLSLNDMGATPAVVSLRLDQAVSALAEQRE